jgi:hypothetical protein
MEDKEGKIRLEGNQVLGNIRNNFPVGNLELVY